jgi:hypothetical protein
MLLSRHTSLITILLDIWTKATDRRKFMDKLAQHMGFDPLVAANWENLTHNDVISRGVCEFLLVVLPLLIFM